MLINIELGYKKKKNKDGKWVDDLDKPSIILSDKWKYFKISIRDAEEVIDAIQELLAEYDGE